MGGVCDEPPPAVEGRLEPVEHFVEGLGEFVQLVAGPPQCDPCRQVAFRSGAGGCRDPVQRAQHSAGAEARRDLWVGIAVAASWFAMVTRLPNRAWLRGVTATAIIMALFGLGVRAYYAMYAAIGVPLHG